MVDPAEPPPPGAGESDWTESVEGDDERVMVLAPAIDSATKRVLSMNRSAHPVDAVVAYLFAVKLNAGIALQALGENYAAIENITDATQRAIDYETRRIMAPVVAAGWIRIRRVDVRIVGQNAAEAVTLYRNNMTAKNETARRTLALTAP